MEAEGKILGFDAREMMRNPGAGYVGDTLELDYWNTSRMATYLFRDDIERPLSIDTAVWPSIFDLHGQLPSHRGFIQDLWSNIGELSEQLRESVAEGEQPYWIIASALCWDICAEEEKKIWRAIIKRTEPSRIDSNWAFLGYDVADRWLTSGLVSCFNPKNCDFDALKKRWRHHLNEFHLFVAVDKADEFRTYVNREMQAHAPFFVHGLWRVEQRGGNAARTVGLLKRTDVSMR